MARIYCGLFPASTTFFRRTKKNCDPWGNASEAAQPEEETGGHRARVMRERAQVRVRPGVCVCACAGRRGSVREIRLRVRAKMI